MTRISRVIIKCVTDCVTAHSCRIAINDLIWLQLSNQTIHYCCTYQYSHSIRLTTYSHNYANKRGKNLNDTKPCGYVRLELTKNPRRPLALPLLLSRIDLFNFCGYAWFLSQSSFLKRDNNHYTRKKIVPKLYLKWPKLYLKYTLNFQPI